MVASRTMAKPQPRPRRSVARGQYPNDNTVDVAVLYERLGHVMSKVEDGFKILAEQNKAHSEAKDKLEIRVGEIETQILSLKWFVLGLAAGGGVIGGVIASWITKALGG